MRIRVLTAAFVILAVSASSLADGRWREVKSDHFIVRYEGASEEFARQVSKQAESYYRSIARDLGYVRYDNFWRWDKRVQIIVYADRASYQQATGRPEWSHGVANYTHKTISSYAHAERFLEALLAHEIAHLTFRDFVGFKSDIPLWLDEGVAQWAEQQLTGDYSARIDWLKRRGIRIPLAEMMRLDIRAVGAADRIRVAVPRSAEVPDGTQTIDGQTLVYVYYAQAVSLVGFLIQRYGADSFVRLCRQMRDGRSLAEALPFVYPSQMRTLAALEEQWLSYIDAF